MNANVLRQGTQSRPFRSANAPLFAGGLCLAYYAGAEAAFYIGTLTHQFAPFWPPNIILLCALLLVPQRHWWVCIAAVLPAHMAAELQVRMPALQALAAFVSNCSLAVLSAIVLRRIVAGPPWLSDRRRASAYMLITALACPALAAFSAAAEPILVDGHIDHYWSFWWRWYLSNALGALTLAPVFLSWIDEATERSAIPTRSRAEAVALSLALVTACMLAFGAPAEAPTSNFLPARLYATAAPLLWAVVRFGVKGASRAVLGVTVLSIWYVMHGRGPFAQEAPGDSVLSLQLFLMVLSAPMLLLGAVMKELHRGNNRLSTILTSTSDSYVSFDRDWGVKAINPQAALWFGISCQAADTELASQDFPMARLSEALERRIPLHLEHPSAIHPGCWIELHIYPSIEGVSVFFRDVTKRKTAELAARETYELLQSTMDALSAHVAILDYSGRIIAVNEAWRRLADASGHIGHDLGVGNSYFEVFEILSPGCNEAPAIMDGLRAVSRGECEEFRLAYSCHILSQIGWVQLRVTRFGSGPNLRLVVAHQDITEIKQVEQALQGLTGRLLQAQDDERRRIARELHDSTAQNLLGVALNLAHLPNTMPTLSEAATELISESRSLLDQSQQEIRTFSYLLHPPALKDAGLAAAVKHYVEGFVRRSGIKVDVEISSDLERLPEDVEIALYRVVQEALANVSRHSGSPTARLRLIRETSGRAEPKVLLLVIEDDGRGMTMSFPNQALADTTIGVLETAGVGIAGMRQRLRQLGGRLEIVSGNAGTVVKAVIPIEQIKS
jgi:two-component system NarL family sensor kinase